MAATSPPAAASPGGAAAPPSKTRSGAWRCRVWVIANTRGPPSWWAAGGLEGAPAQACYP